MTPLARAFLCLGGLLLYVFLASVSCGPKSAPHTYPSDRWFLPDDARDEDYFCVSASPYVAQWRCMRVGDLRLLLRHRMES